VATLRKKIEQFKTSIDKIVLKLYGILAIPTSSITVNESS
jgi:hypothetical protein